MIAVLLPLRTVSEANAPRSKWREKNRRVGDQRTVAYAMMHALPKAARTLPVVVRLVRIAPRLLDGGDNLPMSLKATRDGVADALGIDDRDPRVTWRYGQERGAYGVRVELTPREDGPAGDADLLADAEALRARIATTAPHALGAADALLAALRDPLPRSA